MSDPAALALPTTRYSTFYLQLQFDCWYRVTLRIIMTTAPIFLERHES